MKLKRLTKYCLCSLLLNVVVIPAVSYAADMPTETHSNQDVDPNAPIAALSTLTSLKTPAPLTVTIPNIEHFTTANGTPVSFVQAHNLPMVDVSVYFNAGSARDESIKPGAFGLASLTATMLDQGSQQYDEEAFAQASEQLGISLSANALKDMFIVSLRSLSDGKYLTPALTLMTQMLTEPTFPTANLERSKAQYLVAIEQSKEDPDSIAGLAFNQALYGKHPYAHATMGTAQSIPTITQADLQAFKQRFLVANNANIAITGDISLAQARQIANQLTQSLPKGNAAPALPDAKPLAAEQRIHIPFNSTQTTVIIGQLGNKRDNSLTALQQQTNFALGNEVVGGANFQARLMNEIRKKRGFTYGIYSGMTPMLSQGSYTIRFSTRNEKAKEAIDATQDVIQQVVKQGVTANELALTKDSMINSFPLGFSSNSAINSTIGMMGFYQLPDSYLTDYVTRVKQSILNDVNQTYQQTVDPNKLLIVTVGQAKTVAIKPTNAQNNTNKARKSS